MVIPAMDHIDSTFTNGIVDSELLDPAIRAALGLAKRTLNRYYSLTDLSETYRIAMGSFLYSLNWTNLLFCSASSSSQVALLQQGWLEG